MSSRLVLLGTGTCELSPSRIASSVLVESGDHRVVFDFGHGVAQRLVELGLRQDDVEHVYLSHFHPDHLSDLIPYLHAASWSPTDPRSRDLHLWGPPGLEVYAHRLLGLFPSGTLWRPDRFRIHLHEVEAGVFEIGGSRYEAVSLPPAGNHGLRFELEGRRIGVTGDSDFHPQLVEFVRGLDLVVVDSGHPSDDDLVELAGRARPGAMICSHCYRELDAETLAARAKRLGFDGVLSIGADLDELL